MSNRRQIVAAVALAAALSSTGCGTICGLVVSGEPHKSGGAQVLDILAGVAVDAALVGTVAYVTRDWGPWAFGGGSEGQ
jgi:hypothetical protein